VWQLHETQDAHDAHPMTQAWQAQTQLQESHSPASQKHVFWQLQDAQLQVPVSVWTQLTSLWQVSEASAGRGHRIPSPSIAAMAATDIIAISTLRLVISCGSPAVPWSWSSNSFRAAGDPYPMIAFKSSPIQALPCPFSCSFNFSIDQPLSTPAAAGSPRTPLPAKNGILGSSAMFHCLVTVRTLFGLIFSVFFAAPVSPLA
jgi:hypothetical protein